MEGGLSYFDSFDFKLLLNELVGQLILDLFVLVIILMGEFYLFLLECKRKWVCYGKSGLWVLDWLLYIVNVIDDICVIRFCWGEGFNYFNGVCQMNIGVIFVGWLLLGSWVSYGLGNENENLLLFVVMEDEFGKVINGLWNWLVGFMLLVYQVILICLIGMFICDFVILDMVGDVWQVNKF